MKIWEFVPELTPFTFHWYAGVVPPFIGVAVKVTDDPGQKGFDDAIMVTPARRFELTIIVIVFEVAGLPSGQAMLEVRKHDTRSPFDGLYE